MVLPKQITEPLSFDVTVKNVMNIAVGTSTLFVSDHTLAGKAEFTSTQCITTVQGEVREFTGERAKQLQHNFFPNIPQKVRVRQVEQEKQVEHTKFLLVQGN